MTSISEILHNCQTVIRRVMEMEQLEDDKIQMMLTGCMATILAPFLACIYLAQGFMKFISLLVPLLTLILMFALGLPILTVFKWIYSLYCFMNNILGYFYQSALKALNRREKNEKSAIFL